MKSSFITAFLIPLLIASACQKSGDEDCAEEGGDCAAENAAYPSDRPIPLTQDMPPLPGAGPTFSDITGSGYTISWTAAKDDLSKESKLKYRLVSAASATDLERVANALAIEDSRVVQDWSTELSATIRDVSPNQQIAYAVLVRDEAGNVSVYPPETVDLESFDLPTAGSAIVSSDVTDISFTISWGAASSRITEQENLEYRVVMANNPAILDTISEAMQIQGSSVLLDWSKNRFSKSVTDALGNTTYAVAVLVRSESGLMTLYSPLTVRTLPHKLIFRTQSSISSTFLGTAAQADARCNLERPSGRGPFKALITSIDRIACTSPNCSVAGLSEHLDWVMEANRTYENSSAQILWKTNEAGIVILTGSHPPVSPSGAGAWTGLEADWLASADTCNNWTSTASNVIGRVGAGSAQNTDTWSFSSVPCNILSPLYCVEQ